MGFFSQGGIEPPTGPFGPVVFFKRSLSAQQDERHFQLSNPREFTSLLQGNSTFNECIMYASFFLNCLFQKTAQQDDRHL